MSLRLPDIDDALDARAADVASATDTDPAVVRAIATAVDERDSWESESSGRTYAWPANDHGECSLGDARGPPSRQRRFVAGKYARH